jgi:hypothetical protein
MSIGLFKDSKSSVFLATGLGSVFIGLPSDVGSDTEIFDNPKVCDTLFEVIVEEA